MSRLMGRVAFAAATSCAIAWGISRRKVYLEARHPIDIEYQEFVPSKGTIGQINDFGVPVRSPDVTYYKNHALCYNDEKKIPHWVLEILSKEMRKGSANREKSNFKSDPNLPIMFVSKNEDYWKSGWSRGHMAAAGNHKHDQEAMNDTFFLTNIVPQDADNNAGFWNRVETYCRELVDKFERVCIISGPLFLPHVEEGKKYVKYEVIGKSEVAVPTHLFKIVVARMGQRILVGAFVVPNKPIPNNRTLKEHQVPIDYIESKSGFQFFPTINRKAMEDLCKVEGCNLKSWEEFEMFFLKRKLESAKTLHRLEKVWKEMSSKGLKPDHHMVTEYERKKMEFEKDRRMDKEPARSRG